MDCPICNTPMDRQTCFVDFHDPGASDGHGQYSNEVWVCPKCDNSEPYCGDDSDFS